MTVDELQVSVRFPNISDVDEFKSVAAEMLELTRSEQGTLRYDYFLSPDETQCIVHETYVNSEAHLAHIANMGDLLQRLIELGGGLVDPQVFGNPTPEHREATAAFSPVVWAYLQGL